MLRKWLCLIVALAVCGAPMSALAEGGVVSAGVDAEASAAVTAGDTGLTVAAEATETPVDELPQPEDGEQPEPTEEPAEEPTDEPTDPVRDATGIRLSASKLSIGLKEQYTRLTATLLPEGASNAVTWSSSNKKIVKVDAKTGALTGVKLGSATVTAAADNGVTAKCKVTVVDAPKSVTLTVDTVALSVGQTYALVAELTKGSASALTYKSSRKSVATVDENGVVTAKKAGKAKITVKTFNGKKATCKVEVSAQPAQVLLPKAMTIVEGERKTVSASAEDKHGTEVPAAFTYSAEAGTGKVTVDPTTGEVVGVKAGTAFIFVSTHNGVTTHLVGGKTVETACAVTVEPGPAEVRLASSSITIGMNQSLALDPVIIDTEGNEMTGAKYTVASSNSKKLSVNSGGVIKGLGKGKYTVTVTAANGVSAKCAVKVVDAPSKVTLTPEAPVIGQGQTARLKAKLPKGTMASVAFSSSDVKVVQVDGDGNITGLKPGTATVTAKTHNGKKAKVTVTVTRGPEFIALNADYELVYDELTCAYSVVYTKTLHKGSTFQIEYENEYLTYGDIASYESLDKSVATVSGSGLVAAQSPGTAIIVVRSTGGAEARLKVTVPGTPSPKLAFAVDAVSVKVGQSVAAPALTGENITAEKLTLARYSSGDTSVFVVFWSEEDDAWLLRGLKAGEATLVATAGGASAEATVEVTDAGDIGGIAFESESALLVVGEAYTPVVRDDMGNAVPASLFTDDATVATVDALGAITAVSEGSAVITAVYGAFTASMAVRVSAAQGAVALNAEKLSLGAGQRFALVVTVDGERTLANIAFESSNPGVATVSRSGLVIARQAGVALITATNTGGASAACEVSVSPAPTAIAIEPASISARLDESGAQLVWRFGAPDEMGDVTFTATDKRVATVDALGHVTFVGVGATTITARTGNGLKASVSVTVLPEKQSGPKPTYRLFAAYSFFDTAYSGYLPFTRNNAKSMTGVFGKSEIDGQAYSTKLMGNPSKTQLLSGIAGFFSDSGDDDVSIVFLCSHGQMNSDYTGYRMLLPGYSEHKNDANYYISAREIMNCVARIRGNVVLILDSCYSGTFLQDMSGALDAQGGRIAVMTAASDTRASYYNVKSTSKAVDFFSYFLLQGLGYNEKEGYWIAGASGGSGKYPGYLAADRKGIGNGDGEVSLGELFSYISNCISVNIPSYMSKSWYWGDKTRVQTPRYYAGALDDLAIYRPSKG